MLPTQCLEFLDKALDILPIPAFLCRQTDLLVAAGKTGRAVLGGQPKAATQGHFKTGHFEGLRH
jgi:3-deoxy-D-manno-octulosonic acid (KDO) 8-phosphate synthase